MLVSRTLKGLVAGSGFAFEERGEHELKGVPGARSLYAASAYCAKGANRIRVGADGTPSGRRHDGIGSREEVAMALRRYSLVAASLFAVFFLIGGVALAAKSYRDRVGDVKAGTGPDIAWVKVSNTKRKVTFAVGFADAPPLRVSRDEGWIDMLLIGVDVPPLGPRPIPDGDWRGANFALGTHGPSTTGVMVRLGRGGYRQVARFRIVTRGSALSFSIPRRALGNPAWFTFQVAAAREGANEGQGGDADFAPATGTFRYVLTG